MARLLPSFERLFAAVAIGLALYGVYLASDFTTFGLDVAVLTILAIASGVLSLLVAIGYARFQPKGDRTNAFRAGTPFVIVVVSITLILLGVPSQLRFDWSRAELERVAKGTHGRWRDNESAGRRIGFYRIVGIAPQDDGRIFLDLGGCGLLDHCYFMYDADANIPPPFHAQACLSAHWWLLQIPF